MENNLDRRTAWAAAVIFFLIVLALLTGCTRTAKSVVEVHDTLFVSHSDVRKTDSTMKFADNALISRSDSFFSVKFRQDSVVIRDSVFVKEKGDTVYIYKERWRTKVVADKDTVLKTKTDTIILHEEVEVAVHDTVFVRDSTDRVIENNKKTVKQKSLLHLFFNTPFLFLLLILAIAFFCRLKKK